MVTIGGAGERRGDVRDGVTATAGKGGKRAVRWGRGVLLVSAGAMEA